LHFYTFKKEGVNKINFYRCKKLACNCLLYNLTKTNYYETSVATITEEGRNP
jgi:hypothetical protein